MTIKNETKTITIPIYIAEDGKEFEHETDCLKYESFCRGKELCHRITIQDNESYYFEAKNLSTWNDALRFLDVHLYEDFQRTNNFDEFAGQWVFTKWDNQGEFTRLITAADFIEQLRAKVQRLDNDINELRYISNFDVER